MWGSDQAASLEVHAMDMLRKRLDDIPLMLGDGIKRVYDGEQKAKEKLRG
jgi:N-acetylneuraminate synthase